MGNKSNKIQQEPAMAEELPPPPDRMEQRQKHYELIDERRKLLQIQREIRIKELFYDVVVKALERHTDLITMTDLESYLSKNHRSVVDGFNQKRVIQNVIGDEFLKGHLIIRSIKGKC